MSHFSNCKKKINFRDQKNYVFELQVEFWILLSETFWRFSNTVKVIFCFALKRTQFMRSTHLFHVWINSRKDDWKARRKDEKNKLANTYGSVSLSFLGCTFHFLRMTQTILFLTFQSSSHFQKIAQFSGPHSTFFSFLSGWCLLANKKIFETKITAERTGCNKLTQTSSSVTLTRNYLSDVSRVLILTFVLSLGRSTTTNSQCQKNLR